MRGPWRIIGLLGLALALAGPAAAEPAAPAATTTEPSGPAAARAAFDEAERASRELRLADALRRYREALELAPGAPFAGAARTRAAFLAARAEGDFVPLARLEALRRDPARLRDRGAADAFAREVDAFPPGRVRVEARALLAEAWKRLGDPDRAEAALAEVLDDPAADPGARRLALGQIVTLRRGRGDLAGARAAVDRWPDAAPALRLDVLRACRRVTLRWIAVTALSLLGAAAAASAALARRRGADLGRIVRPFAVAFALYLGGGAAVLARLHGDSDPRPFLWLGLGVLAVDAAARALRLAAPDLGRAARAAWALCCVAGVLAAAFLALERTNAAYLENIGL